MSKTPNVAIENLERLIARDPVLRDVVGQVLPSKSRSGVFTPEIDVLEEEDKFTIYVDVPGVPKDALSVELDGTRLVVRGERPEKRPPNATVRAAERSTGKFRREFQLPYQVDGEGVAASLDEGVLTVIIPRSSAGRPRKVEIS